MMEVSQSPVLSLQELQAKNSSNPVLPCELDGTNKVHAKEIVLKESQERAPLTLVEEGQAKSGRTETVVPDERHALTNGEINGDTADTENKTVPLEECLNGPTECSSKESSEDVNVGKHKAIETIDENSETRCDKNRDAVTEQITISADNAELSSIPDKLNISEQESSPAEATHLASPPTLSADVKGTNIQVPSKLEGGDYHSPTTQVEVEVSQEKQDVIAIDDQKVLASTSETIDEGFGTDDFLSKLNSAIGDDEDEIKCVTDKTILKIAAEELDDDIILIDSPMRQESPEKYKEKQESKLTPKDDEKSDTDFNPRSPNTELKEKKYIFESDDDDVVLLDLLHEKSDLPKQSPIEKNESENAETTSYVTKNEENKKGNTPMAANEEDEDDDDVVFIECNDESLNVKKTEKMKDENIINKENKVKKQILEDDDVVLLEDDKVQEHEKITKNDDEGEEMDSEEILTIEVGQQKTFDDVSTNDSNAKVDSIDGKCEDEIKSISNKSEAGQSNLENLQVAECENKNKEKIVPDNSDNAQDKLIEDGSGSNKTNKSVDVNATDNLLKISTSSSHSQAYDSMSSINKATNYENNTKIKPKQASSVRKRLSEDSNSTELNPPTKLERQIGNSESFHASESIQDEIKGYVKPSKSLSLKRSLSPFESADLSEKKKPKLLEPSKDKDKEEKDSKQNTLESAVGLEFLKKFKFPISTMTRTQLEELVLQKVAEALVYKSEFSQLYELIEKQEQMLKTYQTKCTELTKQFRDLEMVHTRVAKDLQARNSQFVMPVKITRAVGLQVLVPKNSHKSSEAAASTLNSSSATSIVSANQITNKSDQNLQRGRCMQKTTPLRPVPDMLQQQGVQQTSLNRNVISVKQTMNSATTQPIGSQNKIVYKSARPDNAVVGGHPHSEQATTVLQTLYPAQLQVIQTAGPPMTQIPNNSSPHMLNTVRKSTAAQHHVPLSQKTMSQTDRLKVPPVVLKKNGANGRMSVTSAPVAPVAAVPQYSSPTRGNKSFIDLTDDEEALPRKLQAQANLPALVAIPNNNSGQFAVNHPKTSPQRAVAANQNGSVSQRITSVKTNNNATKQNTSSATNRIPANPQIARRFHPAPLPKAPPAPTNPSWKVVPPNPRIRINNIDSGIVISWTMDDMSEIHADIALYQIYAYQETSAAPSVDSWRHVGDVRALLLPMAVTLTQFQEGQRYYFAVRAVDVHNRYGPFSSPKTWL